MAMNFVFLVCLVRMCQNLKAHGRLSFPTAPSPNPSPNPHLCMQSTCCSLTHKLITPTDKAELHQKRLAYWSLMTLMDVEHRKGSGFWATTARCLTTLYVLGGVGGNFAVPPPIYSTPGWWVGSQCPSPQAPHHHHPVYHPLVLRSIMEEKEEHLSSYLGFPKE